MALNGDGALLLSKFARVDVAFGFLTKHRAVVSVKNVVNMANSLGGVPLTATDLHDMMRLAPHVIAIDASKSKQMQHKDDVFRATAMTQHEKEIVTFPCAPQASQRASAKRKKLFQEAIERNAVQKPPEELELESHTPQATGGTVPSTISSIHNDKPASTLATDLHAISDSEVYSRWIRMLQGLDIYKNQIVHIERRLARDAEYRNIADLELPPRVAAGLAKCNIHQLYSHQFDAIEAVRNGKNVVLSTSTASGKSLAYNIPMLASMLEAEDSTFLYLFPTKRLLSSRNTSVRPLYVCSLKYGGACDGDTAMKTRSMVIRDTQIFLTNPDMLHLTILPRHTEWRRVLAKLKLLVVDEAHMYRGVFGSHVACVFKRLFRLCALYGANPQVICCSATIQNPTEHFRLLLPRLPPPASATPLPHDEEDKSPASLHFFRERELLVITKDGSPTGEKFFCLWNPKVDVTTTDESTSKQKPPNSVKKRKRDTTVASSRSQLQTQDIPTDTAILTEESDRISTSSIFQSAKIFARLMEDEVHTILFCRGRKLSELVLMSVHSILREDKRNRHLLKRVSSYRGGYTLDDRRSIERRLFSGEILGVVATNALELGIDIGELDCTMHLGLPTSTASLWQQAGRAGRKHTQQSVAVIICFDSPLDQHFARHAPDLFQLRPEAVALNPANVKVLSQHLLCAASELALYSKRSDTYYIDSFIFGDISQPGSTVLKDILTDLVHDQKLMRCGDGDGDGGGYRLHSCIPKRFRAVNLRSISEIVYKVVTDDADHTVLDEIPGERVFFQVYPTAVYLHQAQEYLVTRLDVENKVAYTKKCTTELKYFTTCRDYTELDVVRIQSKRRIGGDAQLFLHTGVVSVLTMVFGSTMLEKRTMRHLHTNEFSLPPMQSFGNALWLEIPNTVKEEVEATGMSWSGALHGVGHLCIAVIPLFVLCEGADVNTEHYNPFERRTRPNRITIYERREGGSGIIEEIMKVLPEVIGKAWAIADECACTSGCPACIHSGECSEYNNVLDKRGSLLILEYLHGAFIKEKASDSEKSMTVFQTESRDQEEFTDHIQEVVSMPGNS
ncbi:putative atp-dependent RNA helicase, partial [Globisporangium splendens]